jgi:lactoylglutathione lyase
MTADASLDGLSFRFNHTMLPVANLDRAIDFYTRLMGMTLKSRHANRERGTDVALVGYGNVAMAPFLELTQDIGGTPEKVTPLGAHIAIDVSDLRRLCAILETEHVPFIRAFKQRGDGKGFSAWVADPDGHAIELAERHADA